VSGVVRSIFAPDLPGFGDSDPPPPQAGVAEHAAAIGDFLDAMRLREVDLLGQGFGALVATEVAATRPGQVRRLVLVSPPLAADAKEAVPAVADGSHLLEEWRRAVAHCGADAPLELATATLAERLRNGAQAAAAAPAERSYALRSRLTPLTLPILVLRLRDDLVANKGQAPDLPARARIVELPDRAASIFETAPEIAAQALEPFLR
jgi:pimeloyl-ACP methyl ester carboxylesterase